MINNSLNFPRITFYFQKSSFPFFLLCFEHEAISTITVLAVFEFCYDYCMYLKNSLPSVHFYFSLVIFVSAHVIISSITALDMLINLCLVFLLLRASSFVPKFHFLPSCKLCCYRDKLLYQLKLRAEFPYSFYRSCKTCVSINERKLERVRENSLR